MVASAFVQHDMDATPLFPRFEVPLYGRSGFAADAQVSAQLAGAAAQVLRDAPTHLGHAAMALLSGRAPRLHRGLVISGDRFVSTHAQSLALRQALPDAMAVEMEGAAAAQVCWDCQVPFAAVRTVSDRADDQAHTDFNRFIEVVASRYSLAVLSHWLRERPLT